MTTGREEWAELRAITAIGDPNDLQGVLRYAEHCKLHRLVVASAVEQWSSWTASPMPPELLRFAGRALRGELPPATRGRSLADSGFRDLRIAGAVRDLVAQGVKLGAAETLVAEQLGMSADAVRKARAKVRT